MAVSGGADSMALAYLCRQVEVNRLADGLSIKAFVVDHRVREGSAREAETVATWLSDMGKGSMRCFHLLFLLLF